MNEDSNSGFCKTCGKKHNAGFISTRIAGADSVSLEAEKWTNVFKKCGFDCFYFAGETDRPLDVSYIAKEANFNNPGIRKIHRASFGVRTRAHLITQKIQSVKRKLKGHLYKFIEKYSIDLIVAENCLAMPLNLSLGIALAELISESGIPTIAHHHDFFWERQQFLKNAVWDYLNMAFPPHLPHIQHVVINSSARHQLSLRTGISSTLIPIVMDFKNPPHMHPEYASDIRKNLAIADNEYFILQPTRVVIRKGVEHAIELVHRLGMTAKLVISHASGDEEYEYEKRVQEYSRLLKVDTVFVSSIINENRGRTKNGRKIYTLDDVYPYADLVTYPADFEGFGNAFLKAIYFRKPVFLNTNSIYTMDIQPKGFRTIEMDGYVTDETALQARNILMDSVLCQKMVDHNYNLAKQNFSYEVLERKLSMLISDLIYCKSETDKQN